jgi:hypothetical protein
MQRNPFQVRATESQPMWPNYHYIRFVGKVFLFLISPTLSVFSESEERRRME